MAINKPEKIIVHCSDTPDNRDVTAADIHQWHTDGNGWSAIGYHWVIRRDGTLEAGRPDYMEGAHTKGENRRSIGVCMVGRDDFTEKQLTALYGIVKRIQARYHKPPETVMPVYGHCEFDRGKTCPNEQIMQFIRDSFR